MDGATQPFNVAGGSNFTVRVERLAQCVRRPGRVAESCGKGPRSSRMRGETERPAIEATGSARSFGAGLSVGEAAPSAAMAAKRYAEILEILRRHGFGSEPQSILVVTERRHSRSRPKSCSHAETSMR